MDDFYPTTNGIFIQTREQRQKELIWAARYIARQDCLNPYFTPEERRAIADYAYEGTRSEIADAFVLMQKERIVAVAFSPSQTSQEWMEWFENVESHVGDKIRSYAVAQGHFIGSDNHNPTFANPWRAYGERCKRELLDNKPAQGKE